MRCREAKWKAFIQHNNNSYYVPTSRLSGGRIVTMFELR